jgi:L-lactate dehydrogenase
MNKCYIVWAGNVWSSIAYSILHHQLYSEIILVDIFEQFAQAQAMDLTDAAAALWVSTTIRFGNLTDIQDSDFLVITAGIPQKDANQSRLELVWQNKEVMQQIVDQLKATGKTPFVCVVSNPVDVLARYVSEQLWNTYPQHKVFGSGTVLDSSRLKVVIAQNKWLSIDQVQAYVMGEHGDSSIAALSLANHEWTKIFNTLNESDYDQYNKFVSGRAYEIIAGKKSTYYGIGICVARIAQMLHNSEATITPLSVPIQWQYGVENGYCSIPVGLSNAWRSYIDDVTLSDYELTKFQASASNLNSY